MYIDKTQPKPAELLSLLLDQGYTDTTAAVIGAIARDTERGPLAERLKQFDARAKELADKGESMTAEDAALRALLADFGDTLRKNALLIDAVSLGLESLGIDAAGQFVRMTTLPGISDEQLQGVGVRWNYADVEAINALVNYTQSDAWKQMLAQYGDIEERVKNIAIKGIVSGQGSLSMARDLRQAIEYIPAFQANVLMRTLQMESFRDAAAINQTANADILEPYCIRIAALDDRTCMSCVALNGTQIPLGSTVDDHWNGRCTSITVIKGVEPPNVQTGEDWFAARSEQEQRSQMGNAAYEAWRDGAISLKDFPQNQTDPLFGDMIVEASLKGILGEGAQKYYATST